MPSSNDTGFRDAQESPLWILKLFAFMAAAALLLIGAVRYMEIASDRFSEAEGRCAARAASEEISFDGVSYGGGCLSEETARSPLDVTKTWFLLSGAFGVVWITARTELLRRARSGSR